MTEEEFISMRKQQEPKTRNERIGHTPPVEKVLRCAYCFRDSIRENVFDSHSAHWYSKSEECHKSPSRRCVSVLFSEEEANALQEIRVEHARDGFQTGAEANAWFNSLKCAYGVSFFSNGPVYEKNGWKISFVAVGPREHIQALNNEIKKAE